MAGCSCDCQATVMISTTYKSVVFTI